MRKTRLEAALEILLALHWLPALAWADPNLAPGPEITVDIVAPSPSLYNLDIFKPLSGFETSIANACRTVVSVQNIRQITEIAPDSPLLAHHEKLLYPILNHAFRENSDNAALLALRMRKLKEIASSNSEAFRDEAIALDKYLRTLALEASRDLAEELETPVNESLRGQIGEFVSTHEEINERITETSRLHEDLQSLSGIYGDKISSLDTQVSAKLQNLRDAGVQLNFAEANAAWLTPSNTASYPEFTQVLLRPTYLTPVLG